MRSFVRYFRNDCKENQFTSLQKAQVSRNPGISHLLTSSAWNRIDFQLSKAVFLYINLEGFFFRFL